MAHTAREEAAVGCGRPTRRPGQQAARRPAPSPDPRPLCPEGQRSQGALPGHP